MIQRVYKIMKLKSTQDKGFEVYTIQEIWRIHKKSVSKCIQFKGIEEDSRQGKR